LHHKSGGFAPSGSRRDQHFTDEAFVVAWTLRQLAGNVLSTAGSLPDFQQLAGLLGNLMPLLLRFQLHVLEQPFPEGTGQSFGHWAGRRQISVRRCIERPGAEQGRQRSLTTRLRRIDKRRLF
jgi:hypothetical protein